MDGCMCGGLNLVALGASEFQLLTDGGYFLGGLDSSSLGDY